MTDEMIKLNSCPFCGRRAYIRDIGSPKSIMCTSCGANIPARNETVDAQLVAAWNRRQPTNAAPSERMWRTLVRVDDLTQSGELALTVPGYNQNATAFVPNTDVPRKVLEAIDELPKRFHARVNLGAGHVRDLRFEDWEVPTDAAQGQEEGEALLHKALERAWLLLDRGASREQAIGVIADALGLNELPRDSE